MNQIAIIYHSTYGHTERQAEAVYHGAQRVPSIQAQLYGVEEATERLDELDAADATIFGCPTYMGSMSAGMKTFIEVAAKKWFTPAWRDKLNTLLGLTINAMQHGMIFVGLGMMPAPNKPEEMNQILGPGPHAHNRVGSSIGSMAASFQIAASDAPSQGDLETTELYGQRVAEITLQFARGKNDKLIAQ